MVLILGFVENGSKQSTVGSSSVKYAYWYFDFAQQPEAEYCSRLKIVHWLVDEKVQNRDFLDKKFTIGL